MSEPKPQSEKEPTTRSILNALEGQISLLIKQQSPEVQSAVESASRAVAGLAQLGLESAKSAVELISELAEQLTGIKSFKLLPKPPMNLEVEILCTEPARFAFKQALGPFVDLHAIRFDKRISFEALVNQTTSKGLQLDIHEGIAIEFYLGPFIGTQIVPVKGSGTLTRDESKEIILITRVIVPGTDTPVTTRIPIKHIVNHAKSQFKK